MTKKLKLRFGTLLFLTSVLALSSCGGGGGGGDGDDSGGGITYTGNTDRAVITTTNSAALVANVIGDTTTTGAITASRGTASAPSQRTNQARLARQLSLHLHDSLMKTAPARSAELWTASKIEVDETDPCQSGSTRTTGTLNDDGTGTLTITFNNCRDGDETLNGQATIRIDAFDLTFFFITDATLSFSTLTMRSSTLSVSISGSIRSQVTIGTNTERLTVNMVTRDNTSGHMTKTENLVIVDVYDNVLFPTSFSETLTGRVFDSVHGFVDTATLVPLVFSTIDQPFSDSGQIVLTGAGNTNIRFTVVSSAVVVLELDLDGDSTHDIVATLQWVDLTDEAGSDLSDSDGDGMHDSWEQANGLDPQDPSDSTLDPDTDGASNLDEYQNGTDPNNASSTPPATDLSIAKSASTSVVATGANLTYTLSVTNNGPITAADVTVIDSLPSAMTLASATPSQGSCSQAATVTCNLGTINPFDVVTINIVVTATIEGTIDNTAFVTSSTLDLVSSNNSSTVAITAGTSASAIQSQIDAANDSDTITVSPGTYIGTIDFIGKEITVISEQGPLVTIIDGAQTSQAVVSLVNSEGPGAMFSGFTVQNRGNGGVNVSGGSPMITDNIIQNNFNPGSGVGIEVGFSSATVSGNIIRGNGGGIYVRGAASAQILNNLIVDNLWRGGIELFAAGTPLVKNNLISGNSGFGLGIANAMEGEIVQNLIVQNIGPGINRLNANGTFTGNTIALNSGPGISTFGFPIGNQFSNNLIIGAAGIPAIDCSDFGADIDSNLFRFNNVYSSGVSSYAGFCTDQTGTNGNISVAPDFVDPANEDYRLNPTSPVIDAGDNMAPSLPVADFLGNSRIVDGDQNGSSIADIGAYEYIP